MGAGVSNGDRTRAFQSHDLVPYHLAIPTMVRETGFEPAISGFQNRRPSSWASPWCAVKESNLLPLSGPAYQTGVLTSQTNGALKLRTGRGNRTHRVLSVKQARSPARSSRVDEKTVGPTGIEPALTLRVKEVLYR